MIADDAVAVRAALYLRVSTPRQAEQDLSIPDQRRQMESYCLAKGWEVVSEFVEPGNTATDDRRPSFQAMIEAASEKPPAFNIIAVHSFSRFFRDQFQFEFYVRKLAKNGVRLISITQDLGDDPMSVMMRQIMTLFDEYQSKENGKHTLRAMRENARQGFWNGSRPPFGYRVVAAEQRGQRTKKKLDIDPLQADSVRLMFSLALNGDDERGPMGVRTIAGYLNDHGIRTSGGGRWGLGAVYQILTRETYIGLHRFNVRSAKTKEEKPDDEVIEVAVPAIVEKAQFEAVQQLLKSRSSQLKAPRFINGGTLLGGVCFCADCGGAMTLRTSGKREDYRYYTCCTRARQGRTGCRGRSIAMAELNESVVRCLEERLLDVEHLNGVLAAVLERRKASGLHRRDRLNELKHQAAQADAKLTRLYAAIEDGLAEAGDPNLKSRIAELRAIRDAARADVERAEGRGGQPMDYTPEDIARLAASMRSRLRGRDGGYVRHHVQAIAQRVELGTDRFTIKGSKEMLLAALAAPDSVKSADREVRTFVPSWLRG
jgi:site-specific DNA recombinase